MNGDRIDRGAVTEFVGLTDAGAAFARATGRATGITPSHRVRTARAAGPVRPGAFGLTVDHALKGTATLRLPICGVRGGPIDVILNDQPIGSTGELPESRVLHRDGIRGALIERDVKFDATLLKTGTNVIALTKHARDWTEGVLYDYLRLEVNEDP
jgi:rhamnogalacturonan endolyase